MFLFLRILNVYEYIKVHLSQTSIAWRCVKNARNKHQLMKLDHSKLLYFLCVYCKMQMSNANSVLIPFPSIFFVGSIKMFTVQPKPVFGINARFASKNKPFARYSTDVNFMRGWVLKVSGDLPLQKPSRYWSTLMNILDYWKFTTRLVTWSRQCERNIFFSLE